ncbi:MAG: helix-turn-helix domain-containing protein [Saprospiraceae bacterium]|nr:helix-turn-helix domain-containing protein [Saprospiraceae bacterium]
MPKKYYDCPVDATFEVIGGKWKASILYYLQASPKRFGELMALFETCSARILSKQLRELESVEIIERTYFPEMPPKVEYALTAYGQTLLPLINAICEWGEAHLEKIGRQSIYN